MLDARVYHNESFDGQVTWIPANIIDGDLHLLRDVNFWRNVIHYQTELLTGGGIVTQSSDLMSISIVD